MIVSSKVPKGATTAFRAVCPGRFGTDGHIEASANLSLDFLDQLASKFGISRNSALKLLGKQLAAEEQSRERLSKIDAFIGADGRSLR